MSATLSQCKCTSDTESGQPALVYACSGAADVGEIADRAARLLDAEDNAQMSCLAGIGGRVSGLTASAAAAPALLVIDGCPLDCASKTLEYAGIAEVRHVRVTDLGFAKGKSPAAPEAVRRVADAALSALLQNQSRSK